MQTTDLQTHRLYVVLPLPSLITNLTNLTGVLVWLTEVASLANRSASLQVCSLHLNQFVSSLQVHTAQQCVCDLLFEIIFNLILSFILFLVRY